MPAIDLELIPLVDPTMSSFATDSDPSYALIDDTNIVSKSGNKAVGEWWEANFQEMTYVQRVNIRFKWII